MSDRPLHTGLGPAGGGLQPAASAASSPPGRLSDGQLARRLAILGLAVGAAFEFARWVPATPELSAPGLAAPAPTGGKASAELRLAVQSRSLIEMPVGEPSAHASSLVALSGDRMLAFWWAGSRESGPDVRVFMSSWSDRRWSAPRPVVDRESLGTALGFAVRRIGNPVAWVDTRGRTHLYVVATGLGGWAASRIVHLVADGVDGRFLPKRMLPLSPIFNTSVLVRTAPVALNDGGWLLPAYFELGNKYPMLLSFDPEGELRWVTRIGESTSSLQPTVVPLTGGEARAWMRDMSDQRRIQQAVSRDGGENWEDLPPVDLANHNSAVAAVRLRGGGFVLLHNDRVTPGDGERSVLRMSISSDGQHWAHHLDVARGERLDEFSYPAMQQIGEERHVTYTSKRKAIAHHVYTIGTPESLP